MEGAMLPTYTMVDGEEDMVRHALSSSTKTDCLTFYKLWILVKGEKSHSKAFSSVLQIHLQSIYGRTAL